MTQSFFTISFTRDVLAHFFKDSFNNIFESFMLMLLFDALIGNNDRHMYNWGVIRDIYGEKLARFSPIYDSARGLLWNEKESKIFAILNTKNRKDEFIKKYCHGSRPKIGIENKDSVNHFELIQSYDSYYKNNAFVQRLFKENRIKTVIDKFNKNYNTLIGNERRSLVTDILKYRYKELEKIIY